MPDDAKSTDDPVDIDDSVDMVDLLRKLTAEHPESVKTLESFGYKLPEVADTPPDVAPIGDEGVVPSGVDISAAAPPDEDAGGELSLGPAAGLKAARKAAIDKAFAAQGNK